MTDSEMIDWLADNRAVEGFYGIEDDIYDRATVIADREDVRVGNTDSQWKPYIRRALRELIQEASRKVK